jgi:tetratricopeptide (TPR) repeat protein
VRLVGALALIASAASLALAAPARAQDFDPHGRHRPPPAPHPAPAHRPGGPGPTGAAPGASPAPEAATGPAQAQLIQRYTRVVLSQPGAAFPLQRLAQLYRDRDGKIAALVTDFETRAGQPGADQYAATVALAGLYKIDGRSAEAIAAYERAIALKGDDAAAHLALAHLHEERGEPGPARASYEKALALQTAQADKEQTLRTLMALALDQKDWEAAKTFHRDLLKLQSTSLFVRAELGRELYSRGEYERAEVEFKDVVAAAAGDNRALAPALKELGRTQAKAHENREALATLKKALAASGAETALRAEIYEVITEIYRADQQLPALVKELEDEHPSDFGRLALLGALYEETGDSAKAIETFKRALAINPRQIDLRLRMVRLLQANGDLDQAIAEYEGLIRAAPNNPQFVFEECSALLERGDRARAMRLVTELEARASNDEEVLSRVADFYARIGEKDRALRVLQRLAQEGSSGDPGHLVDLGDRYFQDGNTPLAVQTWKRILAVVQPRAKALAALGDVYLEHDMTSEALAAYKEAVALDPQNLSYAKALASAYERSRSYREARTLYEEIAARAKEKGDRALARECRTRIVTLWGLERIIDQELPSLRRQFSASPPDPEAGRMLAEALVHQRKLPEAEAALRRVLEIAPGDAESYLALERVLVQESKIADAIAVLERLAQVEPKRARELYQRMAQYALQIYDDDDAVKYAARAVELNPDDAEGHRRLGEMYRQRQDVEHAIAEYRAAIAKNDRLFVVYFELADLLLSKGQTDEADRLFRAIVRAAPDEELIARAARLSMQINLGKGTLESLEQDLLPLAIGNPQRPMYRHLLVEIYGSMTFGLVQKVTHGTARERDDARKALARVGSRAVKPLLDALADPDVSQQRIAIDVLAYVQNRNAALPLFAYATGAAEPGLRARAMLACGALADGSLVPKYDALLFPKDGLGEPGGAADAVGVAAVWGLSRMQSASALPLLWRVARTGTPAMRALAVLGLGMAHDAASAAELAEIARSVDAGTVPRAAAAYALGDLGAQTYAPVLVEIAEDGEILPRRMALVALARMARPSAGTPGGAGAREPEWQREAVQAMADAVFVGTPDGANARGGAEALAGTAVAALARLASAGPGAGGGALPASLELGPSGTLDVEALLDGLALRDASDADRRAALVRFAEPIQRSALAALRASGGRAAAVIGALGTGQGELLPFVQRGETGPAADVARSLAAALEPAVIPLARNPNPAIRTQAIVLVAQSADDAATDAVVAALEDSNETVQRVAIAAVGVPRAGGRPTAPNQVAPGDERATAALARILAKHDSWPMRILAARALGRLGALGATGASRAGPPLAEAAVKDAYALVRQAALESLASFDAAGARVLAQRLAASDPEARVRETASALAR